MPLLANKLTKLAGSRLYANYDLSHGYWEVQLHPNSQDFQAFLTPKGVFTPARVYPGTTNVVTHSQPTVSAEIPENLRKKCFSALTTVFFISTVKELLDAIEGFLEMDVHLNVRLHPKRCLILPTSVQWCGCLIDYNGWRFDPKNIGSLTF